MARNAHRTFSVLGLPCSRPYGRKREWFSLILCKLSLNADDISLESVASSPPHAGWLSASDTSSLHESTPGIGSGANPRHRLVERNHLAFRSAEEKSLSLSSATGSSSFSVSAASRPAILLPPSPW
ncbi:hypothetical protein EYF80_040719 [Liparis tanakae]|uniref:Uncharacterized protein n=1 Tax=Liparis tanakae TaxID=230148 RepID=A0A4Z2G8H6_9TELE|nr:hypothetical protein EYF80_040719 [Liparis tanakae]